MQERVITDQAVRRARRLLVDAAGWELNNSVHIPKVTCEKCRGVLLHANYDVCDRCRMYGHGTADLVGSMIYGCRGLDSGRLLRRYKEPRCSPQDLERILLLALVALTHDDCAKRVVGQAFDYWATVPSLTNIGSPHPLRELLNKLPTLPGTEIEVHANESARGVLDAHRRQLNAGYYDIHTPIAKGKHVMVIDDTWVSGGHAQSVAMALKRAGAAKVSILTMGRWLDVTDRRTQGVYDRHIRNRRYNPDICPWTGEDCPSRRASVDECRVGPRPMRCSLHDIELTANGECDECSKLIKRREEPIKQRKPWWQFW